MIAKLTHLFLLPFGLHIDDGASSHRPADEAKSVPVRL
jgi:hypothetical protein